MAVNKTAEPWPDERLSDLDHDSWIIKLINPDYFSMGDHFCTQNMKNTEYL